MIEKTIILVKHDGVQRGLIGEVVKRFEQKGLKIAAMKMMVPTKKMALEQYKLTPAWIEKLGNNTRKAAEAKGKKLKETNEEIAKRVQSWLINYLTEGPIVAILFEGYHAIEIGRKIVGPAEARGAEIGTIRGDYSTESYELADMKERPIRNIVHASGNKDEAENEIKIYFSKNEIFDYDKHEWKVMH
ncbi:MAG: nucleoside-diphosphate kinase [Candidatus Woesearchaeota archaeon]